MQRFLLNLRQVVHSAGETTADARDISLSSMSFQTPSDYLGNIGEPLDHGQWGYQIQDESASNISDEAGEQEDEHELIEDIDPQHRAPERRMRPDEGPIAKLDHCTLGIRRLSARARRRRVLEKTRKDAIAAYTPL